jgi:hypothetical protein
MTAKQMRLNFINQVEIPVLPIAYFCAYTAGYCAPIFVLLAKANTVRIICWINPKNTYPNKPNPN